MARRFFFLLVDKHAGKGTERIRFTSAILPPYARRTKSLDCQRCICAAFQQRHAGGPRRLARQASAQPLACRAYPAEGWQEEYQHWKSRNLSAKRYVYVWADGVYLQARMEPDKQCILVLIGATLEGKKELIGFQTGFRESAQSWRELLADLKSRGLSVPPELAIGDGALGFWKALEEEFGATRQQRCWVHKIMNVLNKMPKSVQSKAKADLAEIWNAEKRTFMVSAQDKPSRVPRLRRRSTASWPNTGRSTIRLLIVWPKTARRCWRSTIFLPRWGIRPAFPC